MIDKGYAVAHTMRSSDRTRGDVTITLEDGTKLNNYNLSSHAGLITSWGQLARSLITKRLGSQQFIFTGTPPVDFWGGKSTISPAPIRTRTASRFSMLF